MLIEELLQLGAVFGVGLYVATSPCIFPLMPLFLMRSLKAEESRKRSLLVTIILIAGILSSFGVYIIISNFIGLLLIQHYLTIQAIVGALVFVTGVFTASHRLRNVTGISNLSMNRESGDPTSMVGVFVAGFGYSLLAAPCSGFAILGVVFYFSTLTNIFLLSIMFLALCIGVAVPYLAIAMLTGEARHRMATRIENAQRYLEIIAGILLIVIGLYLAWPYIELSLGL